MATRKDPELKSDVARTSLSAYYNASRLRTDTWDRLKIATARLNHATRDRRTVDALRAEVSEALRLLEPMESYWAFPGRKVFRDLARLFEREEYEALARQTARIVRLLVSGAYRKRDLSSLQADELQDSDARPDLADSLSKGLRTEARPYFEVLIVDDVTSEEQAQFRSHILQLRREEDEFVYDVVFVPSFEDALIAVLFNHNIQTCVIRYSFPFQSRNRLEILQQYISLLEPKVLEEALDANRSHILGSLLERLRPELDLFLVTDAPVEDIAGYLSRDFRRVFYRQEDYLELHLSILKGISERYETPFFTALRNYSQKPTGVFHAMPISRGKSISKSHWIQDMGKFYGANVFLAETSATTGGLDSLLQPHGPLKRAQARAAKAFGARKTYFVTNGTSTANKIVLQALVRPGDIVLVSRDCHKSHHYALLLAGARVVYMDPYPLTEYSMYGAVSIETIKKHLLALKEAGKLDKVKMLLLTNCTFDGVSYHPEMVMREVLAIKPDMVFVWDEAWFAFAYFTPASRRRTAMEAACNLRRLYRSPEHRQRFEAGEEAVDPDKARVRVYVTQSTHKTLTALRQGSMIHVNDDEFEHCIDAFQEAYMTHTSTSPNYQILASLDVGRRQVELEGYEMVQKSVEHSMTLRERVNNHPLLRKYFSVLAPKDLIPSEYRPSGMEFYYDRESGWTRMEEAWASDEFALDPTRVTLHVGKTGMDGDTFKSYLMDYHDIQINKTSRNTVLFMIHIGTTRGAIAYLIEVLAKIAQELDEKLENQGAMEARIHAGRIDSLTRELPPLPNFSRFHDRFLPAGEGPGTDGDLREAFFMAYEEENCQYFQLGDAIEAEMATGRELVSAGFVTPYPPGFPVLVPGQVVSAEILRYLEALDVKEIHGYKPEYGLRVFTAEALGATSRGRAATRRELHDPSEAASGR